MRLQLAYFQSHQISKKRFSKILLSAIDYEMKKINIKNLSVVTQGRNYSALRAYQNSNFKISRLNFGIING